MNRAAVAGILMLAMVGAHCNSDTDSPSASDGGSISDGGVSPEGGSEDSGAPQPKDTAPPAFAGAKSATGLDEAHVAVTWDPATDDHTQQGAIAYRVYAGTSKDAVDYTKAVATSPAGATGATIDALHPATTYSIVVRAVDQAGNEDTNTKEVTATTKDTTPPVFAGVQTVKGVDAHSLAITWDAATDNGSPASEIKYEIFASKAQGGEAFTSPSGTSAPGATSFTLQGLDEAVPYFIVVRAVDANGNEEKNKKEKSGDTLDKTPPAFAGVTSATALGTSIALKWAQATDNVDGVGAAIYDVYMATTAGGESFTTPSFSTVAGANGFTATHLNVSTSYYFVVRARDTAGNEDTNVVEKKATTAASPDINPPTFAGLASATAIGDTTIDLSWAAASDDYSAAANIIYDIYVSNGAGGEVLATPSYTTDPGATSFTLIGLSPQQIEYVIVRARDEAGNEDTNTNELSATTLPDQIAPTFNGLASATATGPTTIALTWQPATDDVSPAQKISYSVFRGTSPGGETFGNPIVTTVPGATQIVVDSLVPQTPYYFVVRAIDQYGNVDANVIEKSATTLADTTAPTFGGVTALVSTSPTTLTASWSPATDDVNDPSAIVYLPYLATSAGGEAFGVAPPATVPGATSYTFSGLLPNTPYYVVVRAKDTYGNVDNNTVEKTMSTQPDTTPPVFNGAASVSGASDSTLTVNWGVATDNVTASANIKYLVCITPTNGACSGASFTPTATVTGATSKSFSGLVPNTTYYFVVRAQDEAANSDTNSAQVSADTLQDLVPPTFAGATGATALGDSSIRINWSAATDDVNTASQIVYEIYQASASHAESFAGPTYTTAAGATSFTIPAQPAILTPNTPYYFVVRARDTAGNRDGNSAEVTATTLPDTTPPTFAGASSISPASSLTHLVVNWTAATDDITAQSNIVYLVCWATDNSCKTSFSLMATTAAGATSYDIGGLAANTTYNVVVRARDAANNIDTNTTQQSGTTLADTQAPTFAGATSISGATATTLTVNWNAATDNYTPQASLKYLVCMTTSSTGCGGAGGAFTANVTLTNQLSYQFTGLTPTTTYYFVVRAQDQVPNTDTNYKVVSGATVVDTTPPTFSGVGTAAPAAGALGDANITLTWPQATDNVSSAGQIAYDIYQATSAGGEAYGSPTYSTAAGVLTATVPLTTPGLLPSKTYYFVVRARDAAGNRDSNTKELAATTNADNVPPTFGGITSLVATSDTQLTASWSAQATDDTTVQSSISYVVCWNVHNVSPCTSNFVAMATTAAGATSYTNAVRALQPNTSYDVVVRAKDASGNVDTNVAVRTLSTPADTTDPTFGGATSISGVSSTGLTVNWATNATDDVTVAANMAYDVCQTTISGGCNDTAFVATYSLTNQFSKTITGLTPNKQYWFVVRARDQAGNYDSVANNHVRNNTQVTATTLQETNPPVFAGLSSVGSATSTSLSLSWPIATDDYSSQTQITFSIYQSTTSGGENYSNPIGAPQPQTSGGGPNTFTVTNLTPNTHYCYVVRARDAASNQETNVVEKCADTLQIAAPTFSSAIVSGVSYTSLTLSWAAATNPAGYPITYQVCYSTTSGSCFAGGTIVTPSPSTSTTYTLTGLTPSSVGNLRYFVVRATDAGGFTDSAQFSGTTTADTTAPTLGGTLTASMTTLYPKGLGTSWSAASDNASSTANLRYEFCWSTVSGCTSPLYTTNAGAGATTTGYVGDGASGTHGSNLATRTAYFVRVRAFDEAGNRSGWISASSVTSATSYATDIDPIFNTSATIGTQTRSPCNGCHSIGSATYPGPFTWSYIRTQTTPSGGQCPAGQAFITPNNTSASLIYVMMSASPACGSSRMPLGGPYITQDITTMSDWINQGALNN